MYRLFTKKMGTGIFMVLFLLMVSIEAAASPKGIATGGPINDTILTTKNYTTCEALITDLLKSSNAPGIKRFREAQVRIVDKNTEKISVELYVSYKITEGPFKNRQTEFTIGWFDFYPATGILQDITNDPERPEKLQYNTAILQTADWDKLCMVAPK